MLSRADYLARWSELHGGYDPSSSPWVSGWLRLAYACARPLVAVRMSPDGVTGLGLLVGVAVPALCALDGRWPILAAAVVVLCGLVDGLDGAVAVLTDRVTRWGYVLDSVVDRLTDLALLGALGVLGAPWPWVAALAALTFTQEYARARAGAAGMSEVGVVTVWERPARIIVVSFGLLGAGVVPDRAGDCALAAAVVGVALAVAGFVQLAVVVRRRLGAT